jgi:hypothetical protein
VLFYIYSGTNVSNIVKYDNFNNIVDNNTLLLDLMNNAKTAATKILKEKFDVNPNLLLDSDANNYYNNINAMQSWLDNSYNGEYGILSRISADVKATNDLRNLDKKKLTTLLTNIYIINYINNVNKQNAESYKTYLKYNDPKKNKYYTQYMK